MIFKGSRYTNNEMYAREGTLVYKRRTLLNFNTMTSLKHVFIQSDTLYNLAFEFYHDPQLWWVILEANPKYRTELDIKVGDVINIPSKDEVMNIV